MRYVLFRSMRGGKHWRPVNDLTIADKPAADMSEREVRQFMQELAPLTPDYIYEARPINIPGIIEGKVIKSKRLSKEEVQDLIRFRKGGVST